MKLWTIALALTVLVAASLTAGQTADRLEVQLKATMHQEFVDGDLEAAIEQYKDIVARAAGNRAVAATALLRLGQSYEKLGDGQFRDAYERLVRDYADQAEPVAEARERLGAIEIQPASASPELHTEVVWAGPRCGGPLGGVSPDGRLVTHVDWCDGGNLAIRDLETGERRHLTHTADNGSGKNGGHFASDSRISPNGEQVVYTWDRSSPAGETGELRLVPVDGDRTQPRTVWSPADGSYANVQDWLPSGDRVVAIVSDSSGSQTIVIVSTVDGQTRQIRSFDWTQTPQARVSPDGQYVAYSRSLSREFPEKDIFLLAVDGSSESVVVKHGADDDVVAWSPGGTHLLFKSDRSGQPGLWAQRIQNAEAVGEPQLLLNVDVDQVAGITRDGTLHYSVSVPRRRLRIAQLDLETGRLLREPVDATDRFVGNNFLGRFSPDGQSLAYVALRLGKGVIVIRSLKTGDEHLVPGNPPVGKFSWRSDGNHLFVQGRDGRGGYGLFEVSVKTGEARRFPNSPRAVLTPDGSEILHKDPRKTPRSMYVYRIADGSVRALPGVFTGHERGASFSLSPDGQWIANHSESEIRLHPITGGDGEVLSTTNADQPFGRWTTWTRDGKALLVPKRDPPAGQDMWRLWVVPVDGSDPIATELAYEPANAGANAFDIHPDGRRIVYTAGGSDTEQYWALRNLDLD